jgi:DNA polymerase III subunit delta'
MDMSKQRGIAGRPRVCRGCASSKTIDCCVPIVPLFGHLHLRERVQHAFRASALPQSLLLHGPHGVGKQRLGLWIAQLLLCEREDSPCGTCRGCRYLLELGHPDLIWTFPRPRLKDSDADADDVKSDYVDAVLARIANSGLYEPPSGSEGIYVATIRFLVHRATTTPGMARRKVFVVGDADRMVSQEGSDQAANAFLKLLEEPPADTFIILTSSAPGALLPTIRSRVVAVRVPLVGDDDVREFLAHPTVAKALEKSDLPKGIEERVRLASGAPGKLFMKIGHSAAAETARRFVAAALSRDRAALRSLALSQGGTGARGHFSDVLDALTLELAERARQAASIGDDDVALAASKAIAHVEASKQLTTTNVNPQLIADSLLRGLAQTLT